MARMLCAHVGDPHGIKVVACIAAVVLNIHPAVLFFRPAFRHGCRDERGGRI